MFLPSEAIAQCDSLVFAAVCGLQDLVVEGVCVDHTILCGMHSDYSTLFRMERHLPFSFPFLKSCHVFL